MTAGPSRRSVVVLALVVLLVGPMAVGGVMAAPTSPTAASAGASSTTAGPIMLAVQDEDGQPNGTPTATPTGNNTSGSGAAGPGGLTLAESARVTPVQFNREYLQVSAREGPEEAYNTVGPYVVFAVSERVATARIQQPKAQATVREGTTVRVEYATDAAPPDETSLYTLELFFADGSSRTIKLYATRTDQIVASSDAKAGADFLDTMKQDAEDHGFNATIEGAERYHEWEKEQADILSNLFAPQFKKLLLWATATLQTPLALILMATAAILAAVYLLRSHGAKIRLYQQSKNLLKQSRRELIQAYRDDQHAADEMRLREIDEIGRAAKYWEDRLDVHSAKQLADLMAYGEPIRDSAGNIVRWSQDEAADQGIEPIEGDPDEDDAEDVVYPPKLKHRGVYDLKDAEDLRNTWLEPVIRRDTPITDTSALAHAKQALLKMTTRFGQPQYRPARTEVRALAETLDTMGAPSADEQEDRDANRDQNGLPPGFGNTDVDDHPSGPRDPRTGGPGGGPGTPSGVGGDD